MEEVRRPSNSSLSGAPSLVQVASAGQAAASAVALSMMEKTYRIVVADPKLLSQLVSGAAEFTPSKWGGIYTQIRKVGGAAIGESFLKSAGSGVQVAQSVAGIMSAVSMMVLEAKLQAIETSIARVEGTILAAVRIDLAAALSVAIQQCRDLAPRLAAIEISTIDNATRERQRTDFDARLRELQTSAMLVQEQTAMWIAEEGKQFEKCYSVEDCERVKGRIESMWHLHLAAAKLKIFCWVLAMETESLRGGANLVPLLKAQYDKAVEALAEAPRWVAEAIEAMERAKSSQGILGWIVAWFTDARGRLDQLREEAKVWVHHQEIISKEAISHARQAEGDVEEYILGMKGKELTGRFDQDGILQIVSTNQMPL